MQAQKGVASPSSQLDIWLLLSVVAVVSLGSVMVFSATIAADSQTLAFDTSRITKHLIHIGLGAGLLLVVMRIPLDWLQISSKIILIGGLLMLALLFVPGAGVEVNGSLRWYSIGGFRMQPSELMKIAALIYFADYLARKKEDLHLFK
ncbi:MAG: FtsW/RodA/SpoVE family cell cycle protein, partial [Acidiferrobacterales bacterium]|nr:FtsW/RodA/SpoVE family cell cycle protein [Acidiferrobacterales bacterium]